MAKWDDTILEYLFTHETGTPTKIANAGSTPVSNQYISQRLKELVEYDFVELLGNGVYRLTTKGEYYLAGAYDAQEETYLNEELGEIEKFMLRSHLPLHEKIDEEEFSHAAKRMILSENERRTLADFTKE